MREKTLISRIIASVASVMTAMSTVYAPGAFGRILPAYAAESEIIDDVNTDYEPVYEEPAEAVDTPDEDTDSSEEELSFLAIPTAVMLESGNPAPMLLAASGDGEGDGDEGDGDGGSGATPDPAVTYSLNIASTADYQAQADAALKAITLRYVASKMTGRNDGVDTETNILREKDNFTVAYSLSINTAQSIPAGALNVRIPRELFKTRDGESLYVTEDGIGVDAFPVTPVWDGEKYKFDETIEYYVDSDAFINYFYDADTDEYVFVNYQELGYANQPTIDLICYGDSVYDDNKIHIFDVKDNTEFDIAAYGHAQYVFEKEVHLTITGDDGSSVDLGDYYIYTGSDGETYYEKKGSVLDGEHTLYQYIDGNALTEVCKMSINGNGNREYYTITHQIVEGATVDVPVPYRPAGLDESVDFALTQQVEYASTDKDSNVLTGKIDTYARVTQASKEILNDNRTIDGVITKLEDIQYYLGADAPAALSDLPSQLVSGSGLNTDDYYFTVWKITTIGECTQPFRMNMTEEPMVWNQNTSEFVACSGAVVIGMSTQAGGYITGVPTGDLNTYFMQSCETAADRTKYNLTNVEKDKGFKSTHYAVIAYPMDQIKYTEGTTVIYKEVKNQVTATLYPDDDETSTSVSSASGAKSTVLDSSPDVVKIKGADLNKSGPDDNHGWLTIYDFYNMNGQQNDMGDFFFKVGGSTGVYGYTHGGDDYEYIDGSYVKLIVADDIIMAEPVGTMNDGTKVSKDAVALDGADYYYSKAELYLRDTAPSGGRATNTTSGFDSDWHIYIMRNDNAGWIEYARYTIAQVEAMADNKVILDFSSDPANAPYRIQVRHNAIDDAASVEMRLTTQIRSDSPNLKSSGSLRTGLSGGTYANINDNDSDINSFKIKLTNYGSVTAAAYNFGLEDVPKYAATGTVDGDEHLHVMEQNGTYQRAKETGDALTWMAISSRGTTNQYKHEVINSTIQVDDATHGDAHIYLNDDSSFTCKTSSGDTATLMEITQYQKKAFNLTTLDQKAAAYKSATSKNSRSQSRVNITYTLSGYEGYQLDGRFSQIINDLITSDPTISSPQREYVLFKDLLPSGVEYDGTVTPKVGKLMNTEISSESFDAYTSDMAVIVATDVEHDWNSTGRTMVTFSVRILDPEAIIANNALFVGSAIQFGAYVPWTMYDAAMGEYNIFAYVANDNNNNGDLWGGSEVIRDDGTPAQGGEYAPFDNQPNFDGDNNNNENNRVYAQELGLTTVPGARSMGISKSVRADDDKYASYSSRTGVIAEHKYTYRIKLEHSGSTVINVKIWDFLENKFHEWQGTPQKIASSDLPEDTVIWIADNVTASVPDTTLTEETDITTQRGWTVSSSEWTKYATVDANKKIIPENGVDFSTAKAVMIEFPTDYAVQDSSLFIIDIQMKAPDGENGNGTIGQITCNEPWYYGDVADGNDYVGGNGNVTTVTLGKQVSLQAEKKVVGNYVKDGSLSTDFTFQLKRVLKEYPKTEDENANYTASDDSWYNDESLANVEYKLYQNGNPIQTNIVHTTDSEGKLTLKPGQSAKFESVVGFGNLNLSQYTLDFQNYSVEEVPSPYWFTEKVELDSSDGGITNGTVIVRNAYRPVLFLTKQITGAPDSVDKDQEFTFHLRISETENAVTGSQYAFYSEKSDADNHLTNKLYAYHMAVPSSVHAEPSNWSKISETIVATATPDPSSEAGDYYYEFKVKAGETLAIPIYIDGGMLDYRGNPKYYFSVEEVNVDFDNSDTNYSSFKDRTYNNGTENVNDENESSTWQPEKFLLTGKLGGTTKADYQAPFNNYYKYRTLLLKKTITNAHDKDMSGYAFHFKLTYEDGTEYKPIDDSEHTVEWELWTTDANGDPAAQATVDVNGTETKIKGSLTESGEFVVPMCGVASTGYVVKLTNVPAGKTLKVEEILDNYADLNSETTTVGGATYNYSTNKVTVNGIEYTLATTDMFKAVKNSEKTAISITGNVTDKQVNLINDYQRRDLSLEKIVASDKKPGGAFTVQVWSDHAFKYNGADATEDATGAARPSGVPSTYSYYMVLSLTSGTSVKIPEIGVVGDVFYIYEVPDDGSDGLTSGGFSILSDNPQKVELSDTDSVTAVDVINGEPGKIIIKKQYTGKYGSLDPVEQAKFDELDITLELSIDGGDDFTPSVLSKLYLLDANGDKYDDTEFTPELKAGDAKTIVVTMRSDDTLIVDAKALSSAAGFSEQQPIKIKETSYTESLRSGDVFYTITPEATELTADTVRTLVKNRVSLYSSSIYKRIAGNFAPNMNELYGKTFTMQITDDKDDPAAGVGYIVEFHKAEDNTVAFLDMSSQGVTGSDGRVTITIPNNAERWEDKDTNGDDIAEYYFRVYFDQNVKINPASNSNALSITELESENDAAFGNLVGYETWYTDILNYDKLNDHKQWQTNADTFVNSVDTTPVRLTKKVHPADGMALTDEERDLLFTFTVKDVVNGSAHPVAGISYNVYNEDGSLASRGNTTDELGQVQLKHGQTAVLQLPSYKFWRIDEVEDGEYRLYTKNGELIVDGQTEEGTMYDLDIAADGSTYGESLAANQIAVDKNNAAEEGGGYTLNSGLNLNKTYGNDVAIRCMALKAGESSQGGMLFYDLGTTDYNYVTDTNNVVKQNNNLRGNVNSPVTNYTGTIEAVFDNNKMLIWCSSAYEGEKPDNMVTVATSNGKTYYSNPDFALCINEAGDDVKILEIPEEIAVQSEGTITWHKVTGVCSNAASSINPNNIRKTQLIAPESVKAIGYNAFLGTTTSSDKGIRSVELKGTDYIYDFAFKDLYTLETITVTGTGAEDSKIYNRGFSASTTPGSELSSVTISGIRTIGSLAFYLHHNLSYVNIIGVKAFEKQAFQQCYQNEAATDNTLMITGIGEGSTVSANNLFDACTYLKNVEITNIETIGSGSSSYAFANRLNLMNIKLTDVKTVKSFAFENSKKITSIEITGVHTIEQKGFWKNNGDTSEYSDGNKITIKGDGAGSSIGSEAFRKYINIAEVEISGIETIGNNAFADSTYIAEIKIEDVNYLGNYAFEKCYLYTKSEDETTKTKSLSITGGNAIDSYIGQGAFNECTYLKTVSISGIKSLNDAPNFYQGSVFHNCHNVDSLTLSDIEYIGNWACQHLNNLSYAQVNGIKMIGKYGFEHIMKASSTYHTVILNGEDGLDLGQNVFGDSTYLKALVLPNGKITTGANCIKNNIRLVVMQTDSITDANASTLTFNGSLSSDAYLIYTNLSSADSPPTFGFSHVLYSDTLTTETANAAISAAGGNTAIHPDVVTLLGGTPAPSPSPKPPTRTSAFIEQFIAYRERRDEDD